MKSYQEFIDKILNKSRKYSNDCPEVKMEIVHLQSIKHEFVNQVITGVGKHRTISPERLIMLLKNTTQGNGDLKSRLINFVLDIERKNLKIPVISVSFEPYISSSRSKKSPVRNETVANDLNLEQGENERPYSQVRNSSVDGNNQNNQNNQRIYLSQSKNQQPSKVRLSFQLINITIIIFYCFVIYKIFLKLFIRN